MRTEKINIMMYQKSELAKEISSYLDVTYIAVCDVLRELEFKPQELTQEDIMKWTSRVEEVIF